MPVFHKIFVCLLCLFFAASCADENQVSSYQKTTEPNSVVPFGNDLQQASNNTDSLPDLFDGFTGNQNKQNAPSSNTGNQAIAASEPSPTQRTVPDSAAPNPAPAAPKTTAAVTSTTLNLATTQKPLLSVTFRFASSYIAISSNTNEPRFSIQVSTTCESGQEYLVELSMYKDDTLFSTDSKTVTCAAALAYFTGFPIDYAEGAKYSASYTISQNGKVLAETSAPTSIFL